MVYKVEEIFQLVWELLMSFVQTSFVMHYPILHKGLSNVLKKLNKYNKNWCFKHQEVGKQDKY
jgi:hypothetical protein